MRIFQVSLLLLFALCSLPAYGESSSLEVTSDPPGAMVVVDHLIRGRTPLTLPDLNAGKHFLRVSHGEDFHPFGEELQLKSGQGEVCHVILSPRSATSLKQGLQLLKDGKTAQAELALNRALLDEPSQPEAYWWLGQMAMTRNEDHRALELLRNYAQFFPDKPELHLALGTLHRRLGNPSAALTSYKLALLQSQELRDALGDIDSATWEAIKEAGKPTLPREQLRLAYMYELKGRIPEALQWAEQAVFAAFPEHAYSDKR